MPHYSVIYSNGQNMTLDSVLINLGRRHKLVTVGSGYCTTAHERDILFKGKLDSLELLKFTREAEAIGKRYNANIKVRKG